MPETTADGQDWAEWAKEWRTDPSGKADRLIKQWDVEHERRERKKGKSKKKAWVTIPLWVYLFVSLTGFLLCSSFFFLISFFFWKSFRVFSFTLPVLILGLRCP